MSPTTPASVTSNEDEMDPLDAYMASLAAEVTEQARGDSISPPPPGSAVQQQRASPSPAMRAVVHKVSASPYCDVLAAGGNANGRRKAGAEDRRDSPNDGLADSAGHPLGSSGSQRDGDQPAAAAAVCLALLVDQPAEFLSRFGHILSPDDLDSLLPSQDPVVALHVARLKSLMLSQERRQHEQQRDQPASLSAMDEDVHTPPTTTTAAATGGGIPGTVGGDDEEGGGGRQSGARVRNRRYRRLQQLAEGGVWFSDEAMKERDPWLWHEHVGKRAGEEKPAPQQAVQEVPGSTSVGTYLQESLGFLSQQQPNGGWPTDGIPIAGGPGRGAGSALGMAFLSGVCADTEQAQEVEAGEDVDCSDVPAATPTPSATSGAPEFSGGVPARRERRRAKEDKNGDVMDETDAAEVTAAVAAIGIGGDTAGRDGHRGAADGGREGGANGEGRRVRFAREEEASDDDDGDGDDPDDDSMREDGGEDSEEEEEETEGGGRDEVARILSERFLSGLERGVDYGAVDGDERLDDLDQLSRDEQDRWFHSEERDEDASMD